MKTMYELHYRTLAGSVVYCGEFDDYTDAIIERDILQSEFPEHMYYLEPFESHKE